MIRYRLACTKSHEFEAWFPSSDACDKQMRGKLVACPKCGSTSVSKALMAPSVVTSEKKAKRPRRPRQPAPDVTGGEAQAQPSIPQQETAHSMLAPQQREMLRKLKELRDKVLSDAEYVGPRFADEARKIHNEEAPGRGIYGEASPKEVEELVSEGIDVLPIPVLPEDHN